VQELASINRVVNVGVAPPVRGRLFSDMDGATAGADAPEHDTKRLRPIEKQLLRLRASRGRTVRSCGC
jgi:hypothetical protein